MSNSQFCIQQRHKERQQLNKLLILGFTGSAIIHGILAYALPRLPSESPKQVSEPMELIMVDKPKPKPKPKPAPKVESKPVAEPEPKPEPAVQTQTPPPPPKPPEPVQAQTPPPKPVPEPPAPTPLAPAPKEVLTTPTPAPSQPIVSAPVGNVTQSDSMSSSFTTSSSSAVSSSSNSSSASSNSKPGVTGSVVAAGNTPPRPEASSESEPESGISCVSNCEPEYPSSLEGVEGSAGVKLTLDPSGRVVGAELADADSNSSVNCQALLAARQMEFSSPGDNSASVQVKIDFTVEGSEYDRFAREEQEQKEQAAKEREEQDAAARQQQLEAEKQAQQEQLEQERQARQELQQQQESTPPPARLPESVPKPLPALLPEELDEERLRKFKERMKSYQEE